MTENTSYSQHVAHKRQVENIEKTGCPEQVRTWTSCALTGFVATTLRAGAEEWKDLADDARRPLARDFLSIAAGVERRMSRATMGDAEGGGVEGSVCV